LTDDAPTQPRGVEVGGKRVQAARAGMGVTDETVATYRAAALFLKVEWVGAVLMCLSIVLLYVLTFRPSGLSGAAALGISMAVLALGILLYWPSHRSYRRLDFPWHRRLDTVAIVVAGSGAIFWLLFVVLEALTVAGVRILP
jgi:hypothetical protein